MKRDLIINFTPTGMIPMQDTTPKVPVACHEIIDQVLEVSELGVNMVHLHAREEESGLPAYRKELYAEIIHGIRKKNKDVVISVSTSGRNVFEFEKRSEVLDLADHVAGTAGMLSYAAGEPSGTVFIVGTDKGLIHQLKRHNPDKVFFPATEYLICPTMKLTTTPFSFMRSASFEVTGCPGNPVTEWKRSGIAIATWNAPALFALKPAMWNLPPSTR